MQTLAHYFQKLDLKNLLPNACLMLIGWSYVPFAYSLQIKTTVFSHDLNGLFAYQACIVLALALFLAQANFSLTSIGLLLASFFFAISGFLHGNIFLFLLLMLLPIYLIICEFFFDDLQNIIGLLVLSLLMALSIPIAFTFMTVKFLSWTYIWQLIPLFLINCFFLAPFFLSQDIQDRKIISLIGIIAILTMLLRPLKITLFIAMILILFSWWGLQKVKPTSNNQIFYTLLHTVTIILAYWI